MNIDLTKAPAHALERFKTNRFGMFIHYGLYSLLNRREWAMYYERISVAEYRLLADCFQPRSGVADDWIRLAKKSGMKYACLTTRHHDGFCLFDTAFTEFNSVKAAAGRDLVREFVDACRTHDIRPALYYSVADWSDAGYTSGPVKDPAGWARFVEIVHGQLKELMSNYGPIDYLFYDGCPAPDSWRGAEVNEQLRKLQPELLISDRCQLDEDVASSEGHVRAHKKAWECCMTTNSSWGCNFGDPYRKTAVSIVSGIATCMHDGGNFLLNLGPLGDGSPHPEDLPLYEKVGGWVNRNMEAVYGTTPAPFQKHDYKLSCARGNTVYIVFHFYHGPQTTVCGIGNRVLRLRLLSPAQDIEFKQEGDKIYLTGLPEEWCDIMPVIAMELDSPPRGVPNPYECGLSKFVF
jgi:alpha-L-fucosidase